MATTSMWAVNGYLGNVVIYIENPKKTSNPRYHKSAGMKEEDINALSDVIEYAVKNEKTAMQRFVSGVNVKPSIARQEMMAVKEQYDKKDGRVAFHGYQSFAPGEVTPELAHEIGVRLAKEAWGDRFQVLVATHLDKDSHIHNHFLMNSVSYADGLHFENNKPDYRKMRAISDRLCREYSLSVIGYPKRGRSKHYGEWTAEKNGKPTWRSIIKADIDEALREAVTPGQFLDFLKAKGYEYKIGKDISVRPPGKERYFRLARNFGDRYTLESIKARIYAAPGMGTLKKNSKARRVRHTKSLTKAKRRKLGGLMGLYIHYKYILGIYPRPRGSPRRTHFLLKEDLAKMDRINAETKLLIRERIETEGQLFSYRENCVSRVATLENERMEIKNRIRRKVTSEPDIEKGKVRMKEIAAELKPLRKNIRLTDDISERSKQMRQKLSVTEKQEDERRNRNAIIK
jgi:hypothetical protein